MKTTMLVAGLVLAAGTAVPYAQTVTKADSVTATATVQAIDQATRVVTLRNEKGEEDTFTVGKGITRLDQVKVGDKVKMTYYESIVFQVRKPDEKPNPQSDEAAFTRAKGMLPGGTIAAQQKRTVTVKAVDPSIPNITVTTDDGRTMTRKIEDKKNIENVKPGDKIDITYTQALLTSLEPAK